MRDPILRGPKVYTEGGRTYRITAKGGLHMIRGNHAPYFSLTADIDRKVGSRWVEDSGGCCHDEILKHWPDLADLAALHLSDIDGQPMHAEANGWYWLAGALGGLGEEYHGASGSGAKTPEECLAIFAEHARIGLDAARSLAPKAAVIYAHDLEAWKAEAQAAAEEGAEPPPAEPPRSVNARARAYWADWCWSQGARWKREAQACIAEHKLTVYGDPWPVK